MHKTRQNNFPSDDQTPGSSSKTHKWNHNRKTNHNEGHHKVICNSSYNEPWEEENARKAEEDFADWEREEIDLSGLAEWEKREVNE